MEVIVSAENFARLHHGSVELGRLGARVAVHPEEDLLLNLSRPDSSRVDDDVVQPDRSDGFDLLLGEYPGANEEKCR